MHYFMKKAIATIVCTGLVFGSSAPAFAVDETDATSTVSETSTTASVDDTSAVSMVMQSEKSEKLSVESLKNSSISELEAELKEQQAIMDEAHQMAESARSLGLPEDNAIIVAAQTFWKEASESVKQIEPILAEKIKEANKAVFTFDVFSKTNLSAKDFDALLKNTPLAGHGQDFYDMEQMWSVNGLFALSVARTESSIGDSAMARNQNNCFGMIGMSFSSLREGILYFGELMNEPMYKGKSIEQIARIYCPPTWSNWASQNRSFMSTFWNQLGK